MKKDNSYGWLIALLSAVIAVGAAVATFMLLKKKKETDNEELEEYLENAII